MASAAKEGASPSPGRRRGMAKKEESEEEIPKTEVQLMVEEYANRVQTNLNNEYGVIAVVEGQNPDPMAKREKKEAVFDEEDVKQSLAYKFHANALDYPPFEDNVMFVKLRVRLL